MQSTQRIGLIGAGLMGHGIARNILKADYPLVILDHPGNQPVDDLLSAGGKLAGTPREVAERSDVIILCVTGTPQVESVLFEADGVVEGIRPETLVIDCSTAIPNVTRAIAERIVAAGGRFMDAAMTRTPKEAEEGRLNLIVGAPEALFTATQPLLGSFAENIAHAGDVSAGHTLKLLHNFVSLGFSAVLAEAAAASRRAGIEDGALLEVLGKGGGGGVVFERMRPFIETGDPSGFRFSVANATKDLGYYHTMTDALGAQRDVAEAVVGLYRSIDQQDLLVPELIDVLADKLS
ncbi:MAG: NAD(P)-dependent oxidoreductase [Halomonas sp.]|uniref:NAD(P)-dependent oxidoreductase n=1 Tax=Halomonas sp. TaxID=1486246 RepID=UPI0018072E4D|nr:NAD(P)-dependent oxidoreductase [Halomonas sp.]NWN81683.1 NAD(P)-dependent oxidoreductase [Halomonas sp.]